MDSEQLVDTYPSFHRALAFILERGLSKADYLDLCNLVNPAAGKRLLPSYEKVQREKLSTRPQGLFASEVEVQIPLQNVLDHSLTRLLDDDVLEQIEILKAKYGDLELTLLFKYGLDGSKGHPVYKMTCDCCRDKGALLSTHLIILQLVLKTEDHMHLIFNNALCNSASSCRPLRYRFVNESTEHVKEELTRLKIEVDNLKPFDVMEGVTCRYHGFMSMIDGKVVFIKTGSTSQRCPFCRSKPSDFHDLLRDFEADPEAIQDLSLSILHFGLRVMDLLFNIGKKMPIKCWHLGKNQNIYLDTFHSAQF